MEGRRSEDTMQRQRQVRIRSPCVGDPSHVISPTSNTALNRTDSIDEIRSPISGWDFQGKFGQNFTRVAKLRTIVLLWRGYLEGMMRRSAHKLLRAADRQYKLYVRHMNAGKTRKTRIVVVGDGGGGGCVCRGVYGYVFAHGSN